VEGQVWCSAAAVNRNILYMQVNVFCHDEGSRVGAMPALLLSGAVVLSWEIGLPQLCNSQFINVRRIKLKKLENARHVS
jgi:hypothetical protein